MTSKRDRELLADDPLLAPLASLRPRPSVAARARLLAAVQAPEERYAPLFPKLRGLFDLDDAALRVVFRRADDGSLWEALPIAGVRLFHLQGGPAVAAADNGLVWLQAGTAFPHHRHLGSERVLVLEGRYRDQSGHIYGPGDVHEMETGTEHRYAALAQAPVLLAVSVAGGLEIEGLGVLTRR